MGGEDVVGEVKGVEEVFLIEVGEGERRLLLSWAKARERGQKRGRGRERDARRVGFPPKPAKIKKLSPGH